jgi:hypothetical protein
MTNFHSDLSLKLSQGEVHNFSVEVQKFSGKVQKDLRGAHLPTPAFKIWPWSTVVYLVVNKWKRERDDHHLLLLRIKNIKTYNK